MLQFIYILLLYEDFSLTDITKAQTNSVTEVKASKETPCLQKMKVIRKLNSSIQIGKHQKGHSLFGSPKGDLLPTKKQRGLPQNYSQSKKKEIFHYFPFIVSTVTAVATKENREVLKACTLRDVTIHLSKGLNCVFCL